MPESKREEALADLQRLRERPLLTYITSHRPNLGTVVAPDVFGPMYEHLRRICSNGRVAELDLFMMTYGGDTTVPLPLQYLLREYADRINVLVPGECFSAGTMIALGANTIVMSPLGQLTPVDPSVQHPLNPLSPHPQPNGTGMMVQPVIAVAVEQVFSYLTLATDKAKLSSETERGRAFERLASSVHPIALGEIHRTHSLIRVLAEKLLLLHMNDKSVIESIVAALTEKLFNHSYKISRAEAANELSLPIVKATNAEEAAMMFLREQYIESARMMEPFDLEREVRTRTQPTLPGLGGLPGQTIPTPAGPAIVPPNPGMPMAQPTLAQPQTPAGPIFPLSISTEAGYIGSQVGESIYVFEHVVTQATMPQMPGMPAAQMPLNAKQVGSRWDTKWI